MADYFFGAAFHGEAHLQGPVLCDHAEAATWQKASEKLREWSKQKILCQRCRQSNATECGHFHVLLDKIPYASASEACKAQDRYIEFSPAMLREKLPREGQEAESDERFWVLRYPG